ncbi:PhzF family phenazine biosynthesis protein [Ammoniphilus sp. CFH 90114]|uniref:PhzF family phenazine biosynthesis protein n=1 Tax=Ammoniphilus sp. CFH 90114 TaxID=2493665 RepID=UPI00100FCF75|nr:PhzF family phenazine biosynthesis isomerase [Ammoniphilus sp. CFH 90114]RXT01918.1 PhzF family phenazine biosynthesis isomerase [Ammoniphilus sp. CFH 90114]
MNTIQVYHYDAFTTLPHKGNPAGVVLNAEHLTEEEMQSIAEKVGFNETAFALPSEQADVRIRFFSPGTEMDLCGHATVATMYALKSRGLLRDQTEFTIETKAGILSIKTSSNEDGLYITMRQAAPQFLEFQGSLKQLAFSMGIKEEDLDTSLPIMYGSTGVWTLLVPINSLAVCQRMKPNNPLFPDILKEMPRASVHPFCLETYDNLAQMHGRHFSSPFSGTIEDPVTGTASGVMGAYYARYIAKEPDASFELLIEQGQEMGKDGKVLVTVNEGNIVEITGSAVLVRDFEVLI